MQRFCVFLFILMFSAGCAVRSVFVPTAQNVVLPDTIPAVNVVGYLGGNSFQGQISHNPSKHFLYGLQLHYGTGLSTYEGQAGTYFRFKKDPTWRAEIVGGVGYTNNYWRSNGTPVGFISNLNRNFETIANYSKIFLQPAIGFFGNVPLYKLKYSFAFSAKVSWLYFHEFVYRELYVDESKPQESILLVDRVYYDRQVYMVEPCITNKVSRNNVSAVIQILGIVPYSREMDFRNIRFSPVFLVSLGVQYNIPLKKKF